ncbi:MAG: site-2 protease family protein [Candidatus Polarisedimenticolaceae bacterium]|nr:site-2 protease family protein [Candidatus Polarisedimenticolaceae bacterium]
MSELNTIQQIVVLILPVLFAITVHEAAHGWVANRLGDPTAKQQGRVTLNPIKHIDPLGTVILPLGMYLLTGFLFGWAKPVPVDWRNLRNPRRDMALVAIAGPASNLVMALLWALSMQVGISLLESLPWVAYPLIYMGTAGIMINSILLVLNLLPILPLDGGRIVASLLPAKLAAPYARMEPWGLFIIVGLLATGMLGSILGPVLSTFQYLITSLVGLQ